MLKYSIPLSIGYLTGKLFKIITDNPLWSLKLVIHARSVIITPVLLVDILW